MYAIHHRSISDTLQKDVVVPSHSVALLSLPRTEATAQHFPFLKSCIPSKVPFGVLGFDCGHLTRPQMGLGPSHEMAP